MTEQEKIDAEQIRALQKQNGELTDKVRELEAQIKKMKFEVEHEPCKAVPVVGDFSK